MRSQRTKPLCLPFTPGRNPGNGEDGWHDDEAGGTTAKPDGTTARPDGTVVYPEQTKPISASERAILERLQSRRQELEARAREIDIRESLLKAAEKRIEVRVEELKSRRIADHHGDRTEGRKPMPPDSRASSPCMRA